MKAHQTKRRLSVAGAVIAIAITASACSSSTSSTSSTSGATPASTSASSGPALTKSPIVIGNVGTYSGYAGVTAEGTPEGLQAWVDWTNAHGGISGHPVQLDVKD